MERDPQDASGPTGGDVERVVRAGTQLAARVALPDVDNAAAIMEWRAAVAALRVAPAAPSGAATAADPVVAQPRPGHTTTRGHEIRPNADGSLDEVCAWGFVHLEQMGNNSWWMGIDTADGRLLHVNFHAKGKITARVEDEGPSDLWAKAMAINAPAPAERSEDAPEGPAAPGPGR